MMKLTTAIRNANEVRVSVALGGGVMGSVRIGKRAARVLLDQWLTNEDFEGNREWVDSDDYGLAYMHDDGTLWIGN